MQNKNFPKFKQKFQQKFFKEKYLIFLDPKGFFSGESVKRGEVLHNVKSATEHNEEMLEAREKEIQQPIKLAVDGTKEAVKTMLKLPKAAWKGTKTVLGRSAKLAITPIALTGKLAVESAKLALKTTTKVVGGVLGLATIPPKLALDIAGAVARVPLITLDYAGKFAGYPGRIVETTKDRALSAIDKGSEKVLTLGKNVRTKALNIVGAKWDEESGGGHGNSHGTTH